jgi:hypothetical protein
VFISLTSEKRAKPAGRRPLWPTACALRTRLDLPVGVWISMTCAWYWRLSFVCSIRDIIAIAVTAEKCIGKHERIRQVDAPLRQRLQVYLSLA